MPPVWLNRVDVPAGLEFFNQNSILKSPLVMAGLFSVAVLLVPLKANETSWFTGNWFFCTKNSNLVTVPLVLTGSLKRKLISSPRFNIPFFGVGSPKITGAVRSTFPSIISDS